MSAIIQPSFPQSSTVAYAASVTPAGGINSILNIGALTGNITLENPTITPGDGGKLYVRLAQDGTGGWTLTLGTSYAYTDDITSALVPTTASDKWDMLFIYNAVALKWVASAINRGTP